MANQIQATADAGLVLEILRAVPENRFDRAFDDILHKYMTAGSTLALVGSVDGVQGGCILVHAREKVGLIFGLGVVEACRRQHLATDMIQDAVTLGLASNPDRMLFAAVAPGGIWERDRFEARGFKDIHNRQVYDYTLLSYTQAPLVAGTPHEDGPRKQEKSRA